MSSWCTHVIFLVQTWLLHLKMILKVRCNPPNLFNQALRMWQKREDKQKFSISHSLVTTMMNITLYFRLQFVVDTINIIWECLLWFLVCFVPVQAVLLRMWHEIIIFITTNKWWPDLLEVNCIRLKHYLSLFWALLWCRKTFRYSYKAKNLVQSWFQDCTHGKTSHIRNGFWQHFFPWHQNSSTKRLEIFGTSWGHQNSNLVTIWCLQDAYFYHRRPNHCCVCDWAIFMRIAHMLSAWLLSCQWLLTSSLCLRIWIHNYWSSIPVWFLVKILHSSYSTLDSET